LDKPFKKNILLKMCKYLETTELFHKRFMYYTQEMIKRSNIRRSKSTFFRRSKFFAKLIRRSKLAFFRRSKLLQNCSGDQKSKKTEK
jgi:hypothetical protein